MLIEGVSFFNSPQFHLNLQDVEDVVIRNLLVHVDTTCVPRAPARPCRSRCLSSRQRDLLREHGHLTAEGIPTFPLCAPGRCARWLRTPCVAGAGTQTGSTRLGATC